MGQCMGMMMNKPVCMKCKKFFRMKKIGTYWTEGMPINNEQTEWKPYKIWSGDLWECKSCGTQIVCGQGYMPVAEQHMEKFQGWLQHSQFQVDDC